MLISSGTLRNDRFRRTHDQPSVMNAFRSDQEISQHLSAARLSSDDDNLKARAVVEMGMCRRNDHVVVVVLQPCQFFRQEPGVMIVDQCDAAHDRCLWILSRFTYQAITN